MLNVIAFLMGIITALYPQPAEKPAAKITNGAATARIVRTPPRADEQHSREDGYRVRYFDMDDYERNKQNLDEKYARRSYLREKMAKEIADFLADYEEYEILTRNYRRELYETGNRAENDNSARENGSGTNISPSDNSGNRTGNGSYDNSGNRTGNGSYDNSGNRTGNGSYDNSGNRTGNGSYDNSGNRTGNGNRDNSGNRTGNGSYDNSGNRTGNGNRDNSGNRTGNGSSYEQPGKVYIPAPPEVDRPRPVIPGGENDEQPGDGQKIPSPSDPDGTYIIKD